MVMLHVGLAIIIGLSQKRPRLCHAKPLRVGENFVSNLSVSLRREWGGEFKSSTLKQKSLFCFQLAILLPCMQVCLGRGMGVKMDSHFNFNVDILIRKTIEYRNVTV